MFNYYADRLGGIIKIFQFILGVSGDRELGLEYIKLAQEKGTLAKLEATIVLADIYSSMENNEELAIPYFQELIQKFPEQQTYKNWFCSEIIYIDYYNPVNKYFEEDSLEKISSWTKARFYIETGKFEKVIYYIEKTLEKKTFRGDGKYQRYLLSISEYLLKRKSKSDIIPTDSTSFFIDRMKKITENYDAAVIGYRVRALANTNQINELRKYETMTLSSNYMEGMK